jgi:hypothetical protein
LLASIAATVPDTITFAQTTGKITREKKLTQLTFPSLALCFNYTKHCIHRPTLSHNQQSLAFKQDRLHTLRKDPKPLHKSEDPQIESKAKQRTQLSSALITPTTTATATVISPSRFTSLH